MAPDDEDDEDLYDDEFDFVDDEEDDDEESDDDESDVDDEADDSEIADSELDESAVGRADAEPDSALDDEPTPRPAAARRPASRSEEDAPVAGEIDREPADDFADEEPVDEFGRPEPAANFRVHIYEFQQFKRTIDRPFTPEDAEAFASEYNRTSKSYGRFAVAGKEDAKPRKSLE
jgi:hypothetical protein